MTFLGRWKLVRYSQELKSCLDSLRKPRELHLPGLGNPIPLSHPSILGKACRAVKERMGPGLQQRFKQRSGRRKDQPRPQALERFRSFSPTEQRETHAVTQHAGHPGRRRKEWETGWGRPHGKFRRTETLCRGLQLKSKGTRELWKPLEQRKCQPKVSQNSRKKWEQKISGMPWDHPEFRLHWRQEGQDLP